MSSTRPSLATISLIVLLTAAVLGLGYNYFYRVMRTQPQTPQLTDDLLIPRQAATNSATPQNGLAATLSAQDKIAQLLIVPVAAIMPAHPATNSAAKTAQPPVLDPETVTWLQTYKPGFVQLVGAKTSSSSATLQPLSLPTAQLMTQALNQTMSALPWPFLTVVRHSAGDAQTLRGTGFTRLPTMAQLCASTSTYEPLLAASATELAQLKIGLVIGPVVDLQTSTGFQGNQVCADPVQAVLAAQRYIENFGSEGIMPVLAHFPGIGQATESPQRSAQTVAVTVNELKPFQQLLKTYPNLGVITSAIKVKGKFSDQPCVLSPECLGGFAKDYPQTLVIADSLPPHTASLAATIKQSLLAGNHVVLLDSATTLSELTQALQQLAVEYQHDQAFNQAVEVGWQHVFAVRRSSL
jgi:hypothetical protein